MNPASMTEPAQLGAPLLQAEGLVVGHGARAVAGPLDWSVRPGEWWLLAGRNGSGKSTLLRVLAGLGRAQAGRLQGPAPRARAYLPQRLDLAADAPLTALGWAMLGLEPSWALARPWAPRGARAKALAALAEVGVDGALARRRLEQMSGGERQRAWLARALVGGPELLLLDEPSSALDPEGEAQAFAAVKARTAGGLAVVMASHDLGPALAQATGVLLLAPEGPVVGTPEAVLAHPAWKQAFGGVWA